MPHTRSQGAPEFELTSPEQILRARQQVSFLDPTLVMEPPPPTPPRQTVHELASHGVVGARSAITRLGPIVAPPIPTRGMHHVTSDMSTAARCEICRGWT
ncbi:hypothetical protein E3N88_29123 [Mikania micrantha]|uniref:Uncharacterized protein n=1 Tax=Mikania micrantha TaxID=192012 RepID=A0A5N6N4D4_9ASTR|nr:hypothetical protein E3N88_29123 [Mikania micrantha]